MIHADHYFEYKWGFFTMFNEYCFLIFLALFLLQMLNNTDRISEHGTWCLYLLNPDKQQLHFSIIPFLALMCRATSSQPEDNIALIQTTC